MSEEALHRTVVQFLKLAMPEGVFWYHCPNGEYRSKRTAGRLKAMGVVPGIPDICLIHQGRALYIELKAPGRLVGNAMKGRGYLSPVQRDCHAALRQAGAEAVVCWSLDDVQDALRRWGVTTKAGVRIGGIFRESAA
jgi:hypothetical protein